MRKLVSGTDQAITARTAPSDPNGRAASVNAAARATVIASWKASAASRSRRSGGAALPMNPATRPPSLSDRPTKITTLPSASSP